MGVINNVMNQTEKINMIAKLQRYRITASLFSQEVIASN